jgi:hypothetical protein
MRHARRPIVGQKQRAGFALGEHAAQLTGRSVDQHHVGMRRSVGAGLQEGGGGAVCVDELDRQCTRGQVRHLVRQRLDALGHFHRRHLGVHRRTLAGIDHQRVLAVFGERRAQALQQHAAEGHVRVRHHGHEANAGVGEQSAQAVGLVQRCGA